MPYSGTLGSWKAGFAPGAGAGVGAGILKTNKRIIFYVYMAAYPFIGEKALEPLEAASDSSVFVAQLDGSKLQAENSFSRLPPVISPLSGSLPSLKGIYGRQR